MIGPTLPPHLRKNAENTVKDANSDAEEDLYGPALPPALAAKRAQVGPAPPPPAPKPIKEEDSDDDGIGPQLPAPSTSRQAADDGVREFLERERRRKELAEEEKKPKPLQREAWMLAPPSSSEALASLDPTKIKNRQFSRATGRDEVSKDATLWTETPAERQRRLEEELSGKRKRATTSAANEEEEESLRKRRRMQEELAKEIDDHNKMARGATLLEVHQAAQASQPTANDEVIWDRERDMGSAGRLLDQRQRNKLIADAKSLGDRFGSGKRGKYDN